jgi:7-cyano-7-deazaguanine synthase
MSVNPTTSPPAIVLLSGGLDSATVLAIARRDGFSCRTLAFDYGQRHRHELAAAGRVSRALGAVDHRVVSIDLRAIGGSALTANIDVPKDRPAADMSEGVPVTYVPARNLIFLSIATALAETLSARDIFIGVNAIDYSGYPDCRPEFIRAFEAAANLGTKAGVEAPPNSGLRIHAPLLQLTKAGIISLGVSLGVDYALTHSCYDPVVRTVGGANGSGGVLACGRCDSCQLRREGFRSAGVLDPTRYATDRTG